MTLTDDLLRSLRAEADGHFYRVTRQDTNGEVTEHKPCPVVALVEEVERLRAFELRAATALGEAYTAGWSYTVDALAAKAEAGKGLLSFLRHSEVCAFRFGPPTRCTCGFDAALARWEAAHSAPPPPR